MSQERTEQATPKRLKDMRKKAQTAKSQDLLSAFGLLGMLLTLGFAGKSLIFGLMNMMTRNFQQLGQEWDLTGGLRRAAIDSLGLAAPMLGAAVILAVAGNLIQVGFLFSAEPLRPKLSNLNPINGFKKLFSAQTLVNSLKAILKFVILGAGAWFALTAELDELILSSFNETWGIYETMTATAATLAVRLGLLFALIGILDYIWQRYDFSRQARMTKQELKDEYKQTEGDPFIKSKLRERRNLLSRGRMMQRVPEATLIVTNPTHYAVALYYNEKETLAPKLIAKGVDDIAQKIIEIGRQHRVPTFPRPELARALFRACEIDDEIPEAMFKLVAELIATIYARREYRR